MKENIFQASQQGTVRRTRRVRLPLSNRLAAGCRIEDQNQSGSGSDLSTTSYRSRSPILGRSESMLEIPISTRSHIGMTNGLPNPPIIVDPSILNKPIIGDHVERVIPPLPTPYPMANLPEGVLCYRTGNILHMCPYQQLVFLQPTLPMYKYIITTGTDK